MSRDQRLPPNVFGEQIGIHGKYEREMDALFERVCIRIKYKYMFFILLDFLLLGFAYIIGHMALICFTVISIVSIVVHIFLSLFLITSGSRRINFGVARMVSYDQATHKLRTDQTPMRRFALLTQHPNMVQWHMLTIFDIAVPTFIAFTVTLVYYLLSLENLTFLGSFLAVRIFIAIVQYVTLSSFYEVAVVQSFMAVIKNRAIAKHYAQSRAAAFVNIALNDADLHLRNVVRASPLGHVVNLTSADRRKKKDSQRFSGMDVNGHATEATPPLDPNTKMM